MADFAWHINIRQEVHLDSNRAIAGTILAATALYVKAKSSLLISTDLGFGSFGKERTYFVKNAGIGGWVRTRGTADR